MAEKPTNTFQLGREAGRREILALIKQRLESHTIPRSGQYERGYTFACQVVEQVAKEYPSLATRALTETGEEQA